MPITKLCCPVVVFPLWAPPFAVSSAPPPRPTWIKDPGVDSSDRLYPRQTNKPARRAFAAWFSPVNWEKHENIMENMTFPSLGISKCLFSRRIGTYFSVIRGNCERLGASSAIKFGQNGLLVRIDKFIQLDRLVWNKNVAAHDTIYKWCMKKLWICGKTVTKYFYKPFDVEEVTFAGSDFVVPDACWRIFSALSARLP